MSVSAMTKVMIVSHRCESAELLEDLQREGICEILDAERSMVTKDWPELETEGEQPREVAERVNRLGKSIDFLSRYRMVRKGLAGALAPRAVIEETDYDRTVSSEEVFEIVSQGEEIESRLQRLDNEVEGLERVLEELEPWRGLEAPVEEIGRYDYACSFTGFLPAQHYSQIEEQLAELGAGIKQVGRSGTSLSVVVICLNEQRVEVDKVLRSADFKPFSFESMEGKVGQLLSENKQKLDEAAKQKGKQEEKARMLSEHILKLQILFDHYNNLYSREQTHGSAPATSHVLLFEGWTRRKDLGRLKEVVAGFKASNITEIAPLEGEEPPVEIENSRLVRPFEVVTRLYGMPRYFEVDPTSVLAPFFAIFFGLCLTDAGYGIIIIIMSLFFIRKMQGDKKLMRLLVLCGVLTIVAGALTGGWFGDGVQQFVPSLGPVRDKLMWFDPLKEPLVFFKMSIVLGYIQIIFGLLVSFVHFLRRREYAAAVIDKLTWLLMLNSLVVFAFSKMGVLPGWLVGVCIWIIMLSAGSILFFSHREGPIGARIGMGFYNLFSAVFYVGDVLSYLRLMALGMVTAGLAMAINVIAKLVIDLPYGIGVVLAVLMLVALHGFNMAINALGAFVHTLRLQYAEFFPKFFAGGGRGFEPLRKQYRHIYIKKAE